MIKLAEGLSLPVEATTQTFLVVGKRGSGKSTTCVRMAEQIYKAGVPVVILDPVDTWWGLKAARDGRGPGLSVYVFGGRHADLPLEPTAGVLIANVILEHRISAVLSVKHFSGRERGRFVADFCQRMFQGNREPLHLFLEESHELAPQNPMKGEEEMLGHVTRIWKLGRSSGLGGSAITQRPASLSKNITTQAEILIVHRTLGPQDVAAIREWIRYHGEREDILSQLSGLMTGEAFVWAPDFPEGKPIGLKKVKILDRETFDSSATPKVGQRLTEPRVLAPVDLEQLSKRMTATIEKAKLEDPRLLRHALQETKAELAATQATLARLQDSPPVMPPPRQVEVPMLKPTEIKRVEALAAKLDTTATKVSVEVANLTAALKAALEAQTEEEFPSVVAIRRERVVGPARSEVRTRMARGSYRMMAALADRGPLTLQQILVRAGLRASGTSSGYLAHLQRADLVSRGQDGAYTLTEKALRTHGPFPTLPKGRALLTHWLSTLSAGAGRILTILADTYPAWLEREEVLDKAGLKQSGTSLGYVALLTHLDLIERQETRVRLSEELYH